MPEVSAKPITEFPDDPVKWDGWSKYKADNPYERLCLDAQAKPTDEQIQAHCTALLHWWQKKLPLKVQPANPIAQLLGRGLDEAAQFIVEARMQLLDPAVRQEIDTALTARAKQDAVAEFAKYVAFSLARRVLTPEAEEQLLEFGQRNGLSAEQARTCIEEELKRHKAQRTGPIPDVTPGAEGAEAEQDFGRILKLSNLDLGDATGLVRRIFITIAENLGIHLERAEYLLDAFLERAEHGSGVAAACDPVLRPAPLATVHRNGNTPAAPAIVTSTRAVAINGNGHTKPASTSPARAAAPPPSRFKNPAGAEMVLIPAGEFMMGSDAPDAAPNERPVTPVTLSEFYISRHPVTNAQYEQFDRTHRQKRMRTADDDHPVVYVTSLDAVKFCEWLSKRDGKTYRLPTEAEWEYAARGSDGRKYPWGNLRTGNTPANFADASTTFAWRDTMVNDGYPETSPVGAFPTGASCFGIQDMAGNVWEWCLDFYQELAGTPKRNPRGPATGRTRVYRGGSWKSRFSNLRATARNANAPNYASNDVGFRVVCECASAEPQ
jgi:formylglycine-generating enzyme